MSDAEEEAVKIPLNDVFRVRQLLEELVAFLHQPRNYQADDEVSRWLDTGIYSELAEVFYKVTYDWLPEKEKVKISNL